MKITICGSMFFAKQMQEVADILKLKGYEIFVPDGVEEYASGGVRSTGGSEGTKRKIANDLIRAHYNLIKNSDAILVLNYDKHGIKHYIGGNSFLEIGFAFILGKKIYLMNQIPDITLIREEVEAIQPIILNGDLSKIVPAI